MVTGASQGIGLTIARRMAAAGYTVVLSARSASALEAVAEGIKADGGRGVAIPADLQSEADLARLAEGTLAAGDRLDAVVACAGVAGPQRSLWDLDLNEWQNTLAVNLTGVFLLCRALLPPMLAQGSGSVVVLGSATGKRPLPGRTAYAASKTALIGLVRTLAWEVGPAGVRVNLVSPGPVDGPRLEAVIDAQATARGLTADAVREEMTEASPLRRLSTDADVAEAVLFLCGPGARATTGDDFNVSSGWVMY